jgi:mRNA-degrading endonuclease toxin of MazEF toxin-antitoxin module
VRRGDVYRYAPVLARSGQSTLRLVVSADVLNGNSDLAACYALHVVDSDPGSLLAVEIAPHGWAFALLLDRPPRSLLVERLGVASTEQMDAVDTALRAVLDL